MELCIWILRLAALAPQPCAWSFLSLLHQRASGKGQRWQQRAAEEAVLLAVWLPCPISCQPECAGACWRLRSSRLPPPSQQPPKPQLSEHAAHAQQVLQESSTRLGTCGAALGPPTVVLVR